VVVSQLVRPCEIIIHNANPQFAPPNEGEFIAAAGLSLQYGTGKSLWISRRNA
jgi:hypothetical protein